MDPEVFLFPKILADRYYFIEKVKKENNFKKTDLVYDNQEKAIYEYTIYNDDYSNKERINMVTWKTQNNKIGFWQKIEAYELVESYRKGELKGKLKEIVTGLEEKSNPIIDLKHNWTTPPHSSNYYILLNLNTTRGKPKVIHFFTKMAIESPFS